jgi:hypothetical protein
VVRVRVRVRVVVRVRVRIRVRIRIKVRVRVRVTNFRRTEPSRRLATVHVCSSRSQARTMELCQSTATPMA